MKPATVREYLDRAQAGDGVHGQGANGVHGNALIPAGSGVWGENKSGDGVLGDGINGVHGKSSGRGYGGVFEGGLAPLRLLPSHNQGPPTGPDLHHMGEFYLDNLGVLYFCVADGTAAKPAGTWKKVQLVH